MYNNIMSFDEIIRKFPSGNIYINNGLIAIIIVRDHEVVVTSFTPKFNIVENSGDDGPQQPEQQPKQQPEQRFVYESFIIREGGMIEVRELQQEGPQLEVCSIL
ncbi:hypothetical protein [Candidatus Cyrtobacter comes]|uniref:hypothetical protein n=1 Tax=Candidatus Cyrtobacter comes TaxID=675776 RepID=UPI002ACEA333|nr:hypothetical protein [Candidatus Cyrtobacter comes]